MDWLLQAATPALEIAGKLLDPAQALAPDEIRSAAETALARLSLDDEARAEGLHATSIADARLALAALLDELALREHGPLASHWRQGSLLQQRFVHPNLTTAGDRFFDRLSELVAAPRLAATLSVLRIYAICLELGFEGRFAAHNDNETLAALQAEVTRRLGSLADPPPPPSPPVLATPRRPASLRFLPQLAALSLAAVICAIAIAHVRLLHSIERTRSHVDSHHTQLIEAPQ